MELVLVIGGGAAGLMAAGRLCELGVPAAVVEHKDRTALKLGITGKGRCNLTNDCAQDEFLSNIPRNPRFLYTALSKFSPRDAMAFFESLGVPLKTERGKRVFPVSDRSLDVVAALRRYSKGAELISGFAEELIIEDGAAKGAILSDGRKIYSDAVIVATGGLSYPATGSTGAGYALARQAGIEVTPLSPSLVPLNAAEDFCSELMGLSLKNAALRIYGDKKKPVFQDFGEMLFTHFGVSGPMILSASAYLDFSAGQTYKAKIDLKPALDEGMLDARILRDFAETPNREFQNSLDRLLPNKLIPVVVRLTGIDPATKVNSVTREERRKLAETLKGFELTIISARPIEEAVVTRGGVSAKELDPRTMEAKKLPGLYFAGEVIDVDGYTGGFNLQIAWMTARLAADAAAESANKTTYKDV